jgi:hypothetical protein
MELDDFKPTWEQFDKKLTENLKFNDKLLKSMNLDKSNRESNKLMVYEISSIVILVAFLIYTSVATIKFASEVKYLVSGLVSVATLLSLLLFAIIKTNMLSKIDYYNAPIIESQKKFNLFNHKYLMFRKLELGVFPVCAISLTPILVKAVRNFDVFANIGRYGIGLIIAIAIGYTLALWIYKNWYDMKIENTKKFLEEINKFEQVC